MAEKIVKDSQGLAKDLVNDCISRQAPIDALDKRFDSIPMEQTTEILQLRKALRELPSAQPEIIHCKDCKWSDWYDAADGHRYCYCMETGASGRTADDFCSYAEREEA